VTPGRLLLEALQHLDTHDAPLGACFVGLSAMLEHVFPPFPGDLGVTLGAALGIARGWPVALLFLAAMAGAFVGSFVTWTVGRWIAAQTHKTQTPWMVRLVSSLEEATTSLDRHGAWIITASRFAPGIRSVVIVAAGFRGIPLSKTLAAATLGAALWNILLFTIAMVLGRNLESLASALDTYQRGAFAVVVTVLAGIGLRALWLRHRTKSS
jgi:membrane protein DedA with SNARE-associated domain